uniref:Uncharacterized protein n=2 Tax=Kalmanozyma brasiliensis (strain GHG001) TaxID=1365824 RepID=V5EU93_KALBG
MELATDTTDIVAAPVAVAESSDDGNFKSNSLEVDTMSGDGATPAMTPPSKSRQASHSEQGTADNHMLARAAQMVLEAARQQARVETRKKGKSAPASPKRSTFNLSPITTTTTNSSNSNDESAVQAAGADDANDTSELSRTPSQRSRSKSDASEQTQAKQRKGFLRSMSSKARRNRSGASESSSANASETPTPGASSPTAGSGATSGTVTPGGRRRRYVDTRDLDLLARELAAEAIAEQVPQPPFARPSRSGTSSPHRIKGAGGAFNDPRRRSFPSILEDSPLQDDSITPVPPPSNGLKPMTPLHAPRTNARARAADGRIMPGVGSSVIASASHSDPIHGLVPREMFYGLGGSPYSTLPPPSALSNGTMLEGMDPFGIPMAQDSSPFDATLAYANNASVYHSPAQIAAARNQSSVSQASVNGKRRPVLTMTMNDPEAEMQGLTTPPPKESIGKRLTPFGSRAGSRAGSHAGSRAASPNPSFVDLKEAAAQQQTNGDLAGAEPDNTATQATVPIVVTDDAADSSIADGSLRLEEASVCGTSRRNSIAPSEISTLPGLAPAKSKKANRFSTMFRRKSKTQLDTLSTATTPSNDASSTRSLGATAAGETASLVLSPHSAAVSAESDADVSPMAFRTLDLAPTQESGRSSKPASTRASRRSSVALEANDRLADNKKPKRGLFRRLSSFSRKKDSKVEKLAVPHVSTMPVVDMEKLRQLSEAEDAKAELAANGLKEDSTSKASNGDAVVAVDASQKAEEHAKADAGLTAALQKMDLSNATPALVNEEMAQNGFGTRSAYKLESDASNDVDAEEGRKVEQELAVKPANEENTDIHNIQAGHGSQDSTEEKLGGNSEVIEGKEVNWDRTRLGQITRSDSQTPSSEDSFFLSSGPSATSRPGSGALMKHGSESAMSEELYTPDPSTAYLPAIKAEEDAALTNVTAAAAAATAAKVVTAALEEKQGPVVTALPADQSPTGAVL